MRARRERWSGVFAMFCTLGIACAAGCSGDIDSVPAPTDAAAGDTAGSSGSNGYGGTAGRGGSAGSGGAGGYAPSDASAGVGGGSGGIAGSGGASGDGSDGASGSGVGGSKPPTCLPLGGEPLCTRCARRNCCAEFIACGSDPLCAQASSGEFWCILACVTNAVSDGGVADNATVTQCAATCASGGAIASTTNDLLACLLNGMRVDGATGNDCFAECFGSE